MYPVAEIFRSTQGEGVNSGRAMIFIRLAGCTVGKSYTKQEKMEHGLQVFQNRCTIYDGRSFPCDTDYRMHEQMSVDQIIHRVKTFMPCSWISITGGEPLMHDIDSLVEKLGNLRYAVHLETSGTIPLTPEIRRTLLLFHHIVVSPKFPYIDEYTILANELRLLVDEHFKWENLPTSIRDAPDSDPRIWISPVNFVDTIDDRNARRCIAIQDQHPNVRISVQLHKLLGVR